MSVEFVDTNVLVCALDGGAGKRLKSVQALAACRLPRRYKIPWWDAMILNSAIEVDWPR